jgi:acyl phosphate:glycerol-3-phosphate acyltransferase
MVLVLIVVCGYLIGSIPAGYMAGRLAGIDIRQLGSGNIGATNVVRTLGKKYGYPVFVFDFAKGLLAVIIGFLLAAFSPATIGRDLCGILGGVSAVLGHTYPVWLNFKGGKGVATSLGVLFALMPLVGAAVAIVWVTTFLITRYVSVASILAAIALPIATLALSWLNRINGTALIYFAICLALLVLWRHRTNISRLLNGTEPRFQRK